MRICELKQKEVINICTCRTLGCPVDVEFDCESGCITAIVVPGPGAFASVSGVRPASMSFPGTASGRLGMTLF